MTDAADDQYRACAREALQLYATATGQFAVPQEGTVKFQATFALAMYALNQVHAALILAENKREYLAVANVRVAYEHAVTAQWVLFTDAAEKKLVRSANLHNRLVLRGMATYTEIPDGLEASFGSDGDAQLPSFKSRCAALHADSTSLFELYQHMSVAVHPSFATMQQHFTFDADHNIVGVAFGAARTPPGDTWMVCAISALASAFVIEVQREDQLRMPQVVALSEKYGVLFDLRC